VALDVDEFETLVSAGLEGSAETPEEHLQDISRLERAMDLYRGDLFAEEPFAEWAFPERERLRSLAYLALRRLVEHHRTSGDPATAARYLERNAELLPFDTEVQWALIRFYLEQGRRSEAKRRYASFRKRLLDEFGEEPDFRLSDFADGRR
jgi:DNA-binding SARP family transcriptional activator